ncbi:ribosomal L27 protein-domain-containing protein [Ilyonectria robusta]|uniref:ribosomal L27 protein-domain-containing protein n=1 Tax=Ilyonectria robusta TaxID=1079257 RepID=UPI001E8D0414|nr:ribosomal L27 protein-domain-containing protein [Ilyonectria robusta]KAH8733986.1 ribosomal L27 protein-domain-containing protein [Ilyonectria robusta]
MRFLLTHRPLMAAVAVIARPAIAPVAPLGAQLANALVQGRRHASVKTQGAYRKKSKRGIPKKLGAKRTGDQFVIPGNILYKQRGTHWWPGENCIMGRDHTIHAMATGYVKYYRDPIRHPDRKYIGVVFNKADTLPYPVHAETKRKLNKTVFTIKPAEPKPELSPSGIPFQVTRVEAGEPDRILKLRKDYSYREDNWRIGRLVQTTGLKTKRFRTRKQWFRHRRWRRERELEGQRKADAKRAESGGGGEIKMAKPVSKKAAKKAAKKSKR